MVWWNVFWFIASLVISYVLRPTPPKPKTSKPKPATLADFDFPTASADRDIPILFGTRWLKAPNVVWYGHLKTTSVKSGGGDKDTVNPKTPDPIDPEGEH